MKSIRMVRPFNMVVNFERRKLQAVANKAFDKIAAALARLPPAVPNWRLAAFNKLQPYSARKFQHMYSLF